MCSSCLPSQVLTISHYADSDKGTYVARVSNSYGCNESHTIVYIDCKSTNSLYMLVMSLLDVYSAVTMATT